MGPVTVDGVAREGLSCPLNSDLEFHVTNWSQGRIVVWCSLLPDAGAEDCGEVEFRMTVRTADGDWERTTSLRTGPRREWAKSNVAALACSAGRMGSGSSCAPFNPGATRRGRRLRPCCLG